MRTDIEQQQYRHLKRKMIAKCDAKNIKWATYYATLLGIGGSNPEQVVRNVFNEDRRRFTREQLALIYVDLEEHTDVRPFIQCEVKSEVLKTMARIGKISEKMEKHFDDKEEITLEEILPLVPEARELFSLSDLLYQRVLETKAQA